MVWNLSMKYYELEMVNKVAYESTGSDREPWGRLLACIGTRRWADISGRRGGGGLAMVEVCRMREYCIYSIDFCVTPPNHRRCDELESQSQLFLL